MKKIIVILVISFLVLSCASTPPIDIDSADIIVKQWVAGLKEKNIDTLMDTYWEEAVFTFIPPDGDHIILTGSEEIRAGQEGGFVDRPEINIQFDAAEIEFNGFQLTYTLIVEFPDIDLINILELEKRGDEWRIINQIVEF